MANWYITREDYKSAIKDDLASSHGDIDRAIQAASDVMPRQFYVSEGIRYFTAKCADHVLLKGHDLLAVTALATDDGTRTYPNTWTLTPASHVDLEPYNAPFENPPHPYWRLNRIGGVSTYSFPCTVPRGVKVTGRWGFYDVRRNLTTITEQVADTTSTSLTVPHANDDASGRVKVGHTLLIDSEQMFVTQVAPGGTSDIVTVERAKNGTTAAAHADNAVVQVYTYPLVDQAVVFMVHRYLRRTQDAPYGIVGSIDGFMRLAINDPDVLGLVGKLFRAGVA